MFSSRNLLEELPLRTRRSPASTSWPSRRRAIPGRNRRRQPSRYRRGRARAVVVLTDVHGHFAERDRCASAIRQLRSQPSLASRIMSQTDAFLRDGRSRRCEPSRAQADAVMLDRGRERSSCQRRAARSLRSGNVGSLWQPSDRPDVSAWRRQYVMPENATLCGGAETRRARTLRGLIPVGAGRCASRMGAPPGAGEQVPEHWTRRAVAAVLGAGVGTRWSSAALTGDRSYPGPSFDGDGAVATCRSSATGEPARREPSIPRRLPVSATAPPSLNRVLVIRDGLSIS